ncbi:hypothetical protein QBC46DRAFT_384843 [Diplogelasinospora grovesii]|uniref:Uncharacterized protein n=1 Tax=Diplogelasinospora grovesii TaxID=303347 RepID=A0AAN6N7G3_9PEZI|nr:hypothetical protein QBC46DRAFT_384843 [Diplogelasinospora grovesii]
MPSAILATTSKPVCPNHSIPDLRRIGTLGILSARQRRRLVVVRECWRQHMEAPFSPPHPLSDMTHDHQEDNDNHGSKYKGNSSQAAAGNSPVPSTADAARQSEVIGNNHSSSATSKEVQRCENAAYTVTPAAASHYLARGEPQDKAIVTNAVNAKARRLACEDLNNGTKTQFAVSTIGSVSARFGSASESTNDGSESAGHQRPEHPSLEARQELTMMHVAAHRRDHHPRLIDLPYQRTIRDEQSEIVAQASLALEATFGPESPRDAVSLARYPPEILEPMEALVLQVPDTIGEHNPH